MSRREPDKLSPAPKQCPTCGGPLEDYRQVLANHAALSGDRVCFLWTNNDYTCNNKPRRKKW